MSTTTETRSGAADAGGTPAPELVAAQREAIETSGWGARFRVLQPRNACWWVLLLTIVLGAHQLYLVAAPTATLFAEANIAAVASSGVFATLFLLFLHHADRYERTPASLAILAFVGGGVGAPWAMALSGNAALMDLYAKTFGQAWAYDWKAGLTAPFVEETAKGMVFVLLFGLAAVAIRTVYDGLIVGAYVGLGFQVLEDMLYGQNAAYSSFGIDQVGAVLHTFVIRSASGIASHALYTALFAAGVVYLVGTVAQPRRIGRGLALILASLVIHGTWDAMLAIADGNGFVVAVLMVGITVGSLLLLRLALRWGAHLERGYLHDVLAPEVARGTLTETEFVAISGDVARRRKDRRAAVAARGEGVSKRREKHVLAGALDLAHDLCESGGAETPEVQHSRAEIARLRAH